MKALLISSAAFTALIVTSAAADARFVGAVVVSATVAAFIVPASGAAAFIAPAWAVSGVDSGGQAGALHDPLPDGLVGAEAGSAGVTADIAALAGADIVPTASPLPGSVQQRRPATITATTEAADHTPPKTPTPGYAPRAEEPSVRASTQPRTPVAGHMRHVETITHPAPLICVSPEQTQRHA